MARAAKPKPAETPARDCSNCTHWREQTGSPDTDRWGECRIGPPVPVHDGESIVMAERTTVLPYECSAHQWRTQ